MHLALESCNPIVLDEREVQYKRDCSEERTEEMLLSLGRKELEKLLTSEYAGKGLMLMMATGLLDASCHARENGSDTVIPILPEALHLLGLHQNPRFHL